MKIIVHGQMELFATNWEIHVQSRDGVHNIVSDVSQIAQIQTHREDVRLPFVGFLLCRNKKVQIGTKRTEAITHQECEYCGLRKQ